MINESYEKSLVNNLFSFDKKRKFIIFKNKDAKNNINDSEKINDISENENDNKINNDDNYKNKSMINYLPTNTELTNANITSNSELGPDKRKKAKKKVEKKTDKKIQEYEILENINKICLCLRTKKRNISFIILNKQLWIVVLNIEIQRLLPLKLLKQKLALMKLYLQSILVK